MQENMAWKHSQQVSDVLHRNNNLPFSLGFFHAKDLLKTFKRFRQLVIFYQTCATKPQPK
jgi:hypothetical protein